MTSAVINVTHLENISLMSVQVNYSAVVLPFSPTDYSLQELRVRVVKAGFNRTLDDEV